MAHKSKTQQQKAAVKKQNKKDRELREEAAGVAKAAESGEDSAKATAAKPAKQQPAAATKKETKPKKTRFQFFKDVRAEMKRVTWPSRTDVMRWSGVVVGALLFFGVYTAVLDNVIITPGLVALTSLGA